MSGRRSINSEVSVDVIELIFSKVAFSNLPTCRLVCKVWNNLLLTGNFNHDSKAPISNLIFLAQIYPYRNFHCVDFDPNHSYSHYHLERIGMVASFNLDPSWSFNMVNILDYCHGLLFCTLLFDSRIFVLNPMTKEYIQLPSSSSKKKKKKKNRNRKRNDVLYTYGFGFNLKTKQYKIVRSSFVPSESATLIEIFALGRSTTSPPQWIHVAFVPFFLNEHGTYFNGALYWIGTPILSQLSQLSTRVMFVIYRFDIEHEKFEEIPFPQVGESNLRPSFCFFQVFNNTLYLTLFKESFFQYYLSHYQVWKMKQDYSWIKAFTISVPQEVPPPQYLYASYHLQLIKTYEDGKILCLEAGFNLILHDPKTQTTQALTRQDPQIEKHLLIFQIDSFNFNPLHKILAGEVE